MAVFAYSNRALGLGAVTAVTGTWATNPPIANLGTLQVPTPHAEVTPDAGEIEFSFEALDQAEAAETVSVQLLGLMAHNLPDSAVVTFLNGATQLAQITWSALAERNRAANTFAVLSAAEDLDTLTVKITSAGSEPIRIGGLWMSRMIQFQADKGADWGADDYSRIVRVSATPWPNQRTQADRVTCTASFIRDPQAWGTEGGVNFKGIFERVKTTEPVVYIRRTSTQADIDRWSIYGQLAAPGRIAHRRGPLNRVEFDVMEIR